MAMTPDGVSPAAARRLAAMGTKMPNVTTGKATGAVQRPKVASPAVTRATVKTNSKGNYARPAAPPAGGPGPVVPSIESYLGQDSGYQDQLRQFALALGDFTGDVTRRRGSLESEYGLSTKALGDQRVKDLAALEDDFGSRGLLRSGLYGKAVGDYEQEYGQRSSDLSRRQNEALASLTAEEGGFTSTQKLREQAAKEAAIRRRAEQYGA